MKYEWDDDTIDAMPESVLVNALNNPSLSEKDKTRIKVRLRGRNGNKQEKQPAPKG